mgnify:CR=1 FL=1
MKYLGVKTLPISILGGLSISMIAVSSAQATSLNASVSGGYVAYSTIYTGDEENPDAYEETLIGTADVSDVAGGNFEGTPGSVSASGEFQEETDLFAAQGTLSASANSGSGELKALASTSVDAKTVGEGFDATEVSNGDESAGGNGASAKLSEVFSLTGTGTATFSAFLDVSWGGDMLFNAFIRGRNLATGENYLPGEDGSFSASFGSGSITDHLLSLSIDYENAVDEQIEIFWNVGGFSYASDSCDIYTNCSDDFGFGTSYFDASGTANIFYSGTDGLNVTAQSDGFLASSAFQTYTPGTVTPAVPLPATGLLLLGGLAGVAFRAGRRKT